MATTRTLLFLGAAFFALAEVRGAPARYDQRQEGDFNVHARLDNFLFAVAIPSESDHLSDMALAALEALALASRNSWKEEGSIKAGKLASEEEPFSVEVAQTNENPADKESPVRRAEGGDAGTSNVSDEQPASVGDGQIGGAGGAERVAKNMKSFEFPKSREVPAILGYYVDARKLLGPKTGDAGRARNVVGNVWNPDVEPGRPGTSLKKQLPQRKEEDVAALPSSNPDKNDVSPTSPEKPQELRLLGDGIENCGPGRRRDASGVCQFDGSAGSLL